MTLKVIQGYANDEFLENGTDSRRIFPDSNVREDKNTEDFTVHSVLFTLYLLTLQVLPGPLHK